MSPTLPTVLLTAVPVLLAAAVLVSGRGSLLASALAAPAAALIALWRFPVAGDAALASFADYAPTLVEVVLILLFGMVLARLLQASGAMRRIGTWILESAPSPGAGAALVVLGIVPFAESVTGFGIGVTVGVPILAQMGFGIVRSALLGLCGLVLVPWGALAPGTAVAASLAGLDLTDLGIATAWVNAVPLTVVAVVVVLTAGRGRSAATAGWTLLAAGVAWAGVLCANMLLGTPLAGVLGTAAVIAVLLLGFRLGGVRGRTGAELGRALLPYGTLTAGLLLAQALAPPLSSLLPQAVIGVLTAPPLWLAVGAAVAYALARGAGTAEGPRLSEAQRTSETPPAAVRAGVRAWAPVGATTALFMLMGWIMTVSGMSGVIGAALGGLGVGLAPPLAALGGVLTGSNTGSNAMFSSTAAEIARAADASVLPLVAVGNAAASISTLASPPRVAMAAALAAASAAEAGHTDLAEPADAARRERAVLLRALAVIACAVAGLVLAAVLTA